MTAGTPGGTRNGRAPPFIGTGEWRTVAHPKDMGDGRVSPTTTDPILEGSHHKEQHCNGVKRPRPRQQKVLTAWLAVVAVVVVAAAATANATHDGGAAHTIHPHGEKVVGCLLEI